MMTTCFFSPWQSLAAGPRDPPRHWHLNVWSAVAQKTSAMSCPATEPCAALFGNSHMNHYSGYFQLTIQEESILFGIYNQHYITVSLGKNSNQQLRHTKDNSKESEHQRARDIALGIHLSPVPFLTTEVEQHSEDVEGPCFRFKYGRFIML